LINDETALARSLGVNVVPKPYMIRFYPKTGRVSAAWQARTQNIREAIKLAILAPPNDSKNRKSVKKLLKNRSKEVESTITELMENGLDLTKWWEEE
jgi:hypothetical protein